MDVNKFIGDYNDLAKTYDNIEYNKITKEYIIQQKKYSKLFSKDDFIMAKESVIEMYLKYMNKFFYPNIKNDPYFYFLKHIELKSPKYEILEFLGKGFFGSTYKIKLDGKIFALKQQSLKYYEDAMVFLNEVKMLNEIDKIKPRITPKYYDSWINEEKGYILSEYMNCGSLNTYLTKNKKNLNKKLKNEMIKLIKILHSHEIFHNDAHTENFLVKCEENKKGKIKSDGKIKIYINDFGISKSIDRMKKSDIMRIDENINSRFLNLDPRAMNLKQLPTNTLFPILIINKLLIENKISSIWF